MSSGWRAGWLQIQPFRGGLRDIVPAPRGMRAVGEGAALSLLRRFVDVDTGVCGEGGVDEATEVTGVTGFMCRPLRPDGPGFLGGVGVAVREMGVWDR